MILQEVQDAFALMYADCLDEESLDHMIQWLEDNAELINVEAPVVLQEAA